MWKNSLKNVECDNNKILYENLFDFFLQRNGTYCLNKPRKTHTNNNFIVSICLLVMLIIMLNINRRFLSFQTLDSHMKLKDTWFRQ